MRRKIFEQQAVDLTTGEIVITKTQHISKDEETYIMHRTTEGLEWMKDLSALEMKIISVMVNNKGRRDNRIDFTPARILDMCKTFDLKPVTIENSLRGLRQKGIVKKLSMHSYLVSPLTIYSGGTKNWPTMYKEFLQAKDINYDK